MRRFVRNDITGEYHILHSAAEVPAPDNLNVANFLRDTDMLEPLGSQDASHRIRRDGAGNSTGVGCRVFPDLLRDFTRPEHIGDDHAASRSQYPEDLPVDGLLAVGEIDDAVGEYEIHA